MLGAERSGICPPDISRKKRRRPETSVARWFVFKPKIPILVKFGGPWDRKCCYILRPFGIFYGYLV
jgi:hypothetical protein